MDLLEQAIAPPLRLLRVFAGNEWVQRKGLDKKLEKLLLKGSGVGFKAATQVGRVFAPAMSLGKPARMDRPEKPSRFDLRLTEEEQMVQDTMRRFADDVLREAARPADAACEPPPELLAQALELGLAMMAVPEAAGGAGTQRSEVQSVIVLEELARGDMGLAFAITAPLGFVHALADYGTAEQQARYLPPFAEDDAPAAALAIVEPTPVFDPERLSTGAVRTGDGYRLYGTKSMVPLAATAEVFLVAAELPGRGPCLFLVERGAEGVSVEREPTMGLRGAGIGRLRLDGAKVPLDAMLGGEEGGVDYRGLIDRARIAWGAMAVGGAQAVLEYTANYANERQAFGEPISNRQAIAFLIADMAIEIESMRLLVYRAASRAQHGLPFSREAFLARALCAEKSMKIGTDGVQVLGGHGFITDHPVELWYRHLRAVGVMEGALLV